MTSTLIGTWTLLKAEVDGDAAPDLLALDITLELTVDSYAVRFGGEIADRGTYSLRDLGPPHAMILVGVEGPNQGRTIPCIFQHVGDRMRICYGLDGTAPTKFATTSGSRHYLATYRRKAGEPSA